MDSDRSKTGEEDERSEGVEVSSRDLQECIMAEINEILQRERRGIVERAHKRLREKRGEKLS